MSLNFFGQTKLEIELLGYAELKTDFPPPENYLKPTGGMLARIIVDGLRKHKFDVSEPEAVDFANYVECKMGNCIFELMIGAEVNEDEDNRWYVLPSLKKRKCRTTEATREDLQKLLIALSHVLNQSERVSDLSWYPAFDTPEFLALMPKSSSPVPGPDYLEQVHPLIRFYWRSNMFFNRLHSPLAILSFFMFTCLMFVAFQQVGAYISFSIFLIGFLATILTPIVVSILVARTAKQLEYKD